MQNIFFYDSGNGFPVIFLHGFCETNSIWKSLSEDLYDEFRVVCPDLPGFGESPLPQSSFTLEDIGDRIVSKIQELGIRRCIVIGHSLGGYIALEILRKYPDFAVAVGLINSSAFEDTRDKKANRNKLIDFIRENGVEPFLKTFVPSLFYPKTAEKHKETIKEISLKGMLIKPESVTAYAAAMRDRRDSMDLLHKYSKKILLIAGEFDQNIPVEKSKEMAAFLDENNVYIIPNSAHLSHFEQPELCKEAVRNFLHKKSKKR